MSEDWGDGFSEPFELTSFTTISKDNNCVEANRRYFKCFNCHGSLNTNQILIDSFGYFTSLEETKFTTDFIVSRENKCGNVSLFGRKWDKGSALYKHIHQFFKMSRKEIMQIEQGTKLSASAFGNNIIRSDSQNRNYRQSRFYIIEFYLFLRNSLKILCADEEYSWMLKDLFHTIKQHLNVFRKSLNHLIDLPDYIYNHAANSNGNKTSQASYHLMHIHLDIRWLHLTSLEVLSKARLIGDPGNENAPINAEDLGSECVYAEINLLISELIELAVKRFEKVDLHQLKNVSAFHCTCVQELWMLIINLIYELYTIHKGKLFWDFVYIHLDVNMIRSLEDTTLPSYSHSYFKEKPLECSMFFLWMLYHIALLHKFVIKDSSNLYSLLETNLKLLFSKDVSEANIRIILQFVEKLCVDVWEPKPEVILILWEHFHKKMNSSFYIHGAPPISLAVASKTPSSLVNQLNSFLIDGGSICDSFQHFLRIIGLHLQKSKKIPRNWNLIRGRMYSKLTYAKLESLSDIGQYHFISLFLILAVSQNLNQIESKMVEIISLYYSKKNYISEQLVKGQLALVLMLIKDGKDASVALQPITNYFQEIAIHEQPDLFRMYVQTFQDILTLDQPLSLGQHLLIDKWIYEYLSLSSETDVSRLLDTIVALLRKLKLCSDTEISEQQIILVIEKLWDQLKKYVDSMSSQNETPYQLSEIAASLATISIRIRNRERFVEIVNMFVYRNVTDVSVLRQFVCSISDNEFVKNDFPSYEKVMLKTWVKCSFLCLDMDHTEMRTLTKAVVKLPEMISLLGDDSGRLIYSSEPLLEFCSILHNKYTTGDLWKRQTLREKVFCYFDGVVTWIHPIINPPKDSVKVLSLYNISGNLVRLNSPLLYVKSKPNTLLQQLIDLLLLPISVRDSEAKIHPHVLVAIKSSLHLFIEGLIYLDPENDHYISRILKELVTVYLPHCMNSQHNFTLISYFSNYGNGFMSLLLDIISNNFFKRKLKNQHPSALSALKFLREVLTSHKTNVSVLIAVIKKSLERICDIIMYCEEKSLVNNSAKEILIFILSSQTVRASEQIIEEVMTIFRILCQEHLAWSSRQFFDLLIFISSEAPDMVKRFTPRLINEVKLVEAKRGVGYDKTLRLGIERIERNLRAIKDVV